MTIKSFKIELKKSQNLNLISTFFMQYPYIEII